MKNTVKSYIAYVAILLSSMLNTSCSDSDKEECDVLIQPTEVPVCFIVRDNEGNNLLDPAFEGNILDRNIEVTYEGAPYSLQLSEYPFDLMLGLYTGKIEVGMDIIPGIMFWYLYMEGDCVSHRFSINWGDGVTDEVKIDYYYTLVKCEPVPHMKTYLNGKLYSDNSLIINMIK